MQKVEEMDGVSVIIPAYNEEDGIAEVIGRVNKTLSGFCPYEIIVIDDGSTDRTRERAESLGVRLITHPRNVGYGFALKRGFVEARFECVVITDADGTYPVERIPDFVIEYQKGFDMIVGARQGRVYTQGGVKYAFRLCFKWMSEFVSGKKIPDINSGFRVIRRRKMLPLLPDLSNAFSFTTSSTLLFFLKHYFVCYLPISYDPRKGKTKVKYLRDALIAVQIMVEIIARYNPIKLFLFISFFPAFFALVFFVLFAYDPQSLFLSLGVISALFSLGILSMGFFAVAFKKY